MLPECKPLAQAPDLVEILRLGKGAALDSRYSHDGKLLAVGSYIGVHIYLAPHFDQHHFLETNCTVADSEYRSPWAFSPDDRWLVTPYVHGMAVWNMENFQLQRAITLGEKLYWDPDVAVSWDSRYFAVNLDQTLLVYDIVHDEVIQFPAKYGYICRFVRDTTLVAGAEIGGNVVVFDLKHNKLHSTFKFRDQPQVFSPDGCFFASADRHQVSLYDVVSGELRHTFDVPDAVGIMHRVDFNHNAPVIEIVGHSQTEFHPDLPLLKFLFDVHTGQQLAIRNLDDETWTPEISDAQKRQLGYPKIRTERGPERTQIVTPYDDFIRSLAISHDGQYLASAYYNRVLVTDLETGEIIQNLDLPSAKVYADPDQDRLYILGKGVYYQGTFLKGAPGLKRTGQCLAARGQYLAAKNQDGMSIWHMEDASEVWRISQTEVPRCAVFTSDAKHIVFGGRNRTAYKWDLTSGELVYTFTGKDSINCVAISSNELLLALGDHSGNVFLYELPTGRQVATFKHDQDRIGKSVRAMVFSKDDRWLFSAGADHKIYLWDMNLFEPYAVLPGHTRPVECLAVADTFVVSGGGDCVIRFWGNPIQ